MSEPPITATFRSLVAAAERKFATVQDSSSHLHLRLHHHHFRKVFKAYTKLWKFQIENRTELVQLGFQRWEIGEIASRIGQLYYFQYLRTSEVRFLIESYVFYEAILNRKYFDGSSKNLSVRHKELRFYARFLVVCLLLNRMEMVRDLTDRFKVLVEDCRLNFQDSNFKEWKQLVQEIVRFLKVDEAFINVRPLRYSLLFDAHPSSASYLASFHSKRFLKLQNAIVASCRRNEVKFTEISLDTFRILQCLEWEPSGSFYKSNMEEISGNGALSDQVAASGPIDMNLVADITDPTLPPNPRKSLLYHPSVTHLISVIAAICEELSSDNILLIYISASGQSKARSNSSKMENYLNLRSFSKKDHKDQSDPQPAMPDEGDFNASFGNYLCLGSRGGGGSNNLYPSDIVPFTRKPLFLVIDSDNSHAFKAIYGEEKGETAALLLSPIKTTLSTQCSTDLTQNGSQFTFFLASPMQAFFQLVGFSKFNTDVTTYKADTILSSIFSEWEVSLCTSNCLHHVWAQVLSDPLLRRLIIRFIFCRSVMYLFCNEENQDDYLPKCFPHLPDAVSPSTLSIQCNIFRLADAVGVAKHFHFSDDVKNSVMKNAKDSNSP